MKRYYMSLKPCEFSLTDMKTNRTTKFNNLEELLTVALKSSCKVYLFELTTFSKAIVNMFFRFGYKEVSTNSMDNVVRGKLNNNEFVVIGGDSINAIRSRRTTKATTMFINAKGQFSTKATIKDICASVGETDEITGMVKALNDLYENGHRSLTASGNAFNDLKKRCFSNKDGNFAEKNFRERFPELNKDVHDFVFKSFQGGLCLYNKKYEGQNYVVGRAYDVNSMFSSIMIQEDMPYGKETYFKGKYVAREYNKLSGKIKNRLYFQRVKIGHMVVKEGGFPVIKNQMREGLRLALGFSKYINNAKNVELVLNSIDLEILFDNYDVTDIEYVDGYYFEKRRGERFFGKYINHWMKKKIEAKTPFERMVAKQFLNSSYGKFVTKTEKVSYEYVEIDGEYKRARNFQTNSMPSVYAPVGAYITSYARKRLLDAIKQQGDNFIYSDTDSIYVKNKAVGIDVDATELGKWKCEFAFNKFNILGKKQYCVQKANGEAKVVLAGIDDHIVKDNIKNFNDFYEGKVIEGFRDNYNLNGEKITNKVSVLLNNENIE